MKIFIYNKNIELQTFILNLANCINSKNNKIYVIGIKNSSVRKYPNKNIRQLILWDNYSNFKSFALIVYYLLRSFYSNPKTSMNNLKSLLLSKISKENLINFNIKNIFLIFQPDIIHVQWASHILSFKFLFNIPIDIRPKIIISLRGRLINITPRVDHKTAELYRKTFPIVDGFHAVSSAIGFEALRWGAEENKIRVIYSGLDLAKINTYTKKCWEIGPVAKILSVGRFHWKKGYHLALDGLKMLLDRGRAVHYTIIAPGVPDEVLYQIKDQQLNAFVEIIPGMAQSRVFEKMTEADIFLLPSVEEGIANVVLEAMAIGLPVVSSDCGGMDEVIQNNTTGLLFNTRNIPDMVAQIEKMLDDTVQGREAFAQSARQKVEQQHSLEGFRADFNQFYNSVL